MFSILNRIKVTHGGKPRSKALPGIIQISENHLLIAYRDASTHPVGEHKLVDDGVIKITRSFNGGLTWSESIIAWSEKNWDCAGSRTLINTPNGLVMFVFKAKRENLNHPISNIQTIISSDHGYTWQLHGNSFNLHSNWTEMNTSGTLHILNDGSWLVPVYGADKAEGPTYPSIAKSNDHGRSWTIIESIKTSDAVELHECSIVKVNEDKFLGIIRSQTPPYLSYYSFSNNDCRNWSEAKPMNFYGQTPALIKMKSGILLFAYRNMNEYQKGVGISFSKDFGNTWTKTKMIYESNSFNCGYPSLLELDKETVMCIYYTEYDLNNNCDIEGVILKINI